MKIVTNYIIIVNNKPAVMVDDKRQVSVILEKAKQKGKEVKVRQVTASSTRMSEIGHNLFKVNVDDSIKSNIQNFRNKVVLECIAYKEDKKVDEEIAWKRISKKLDKEISSMSFNQFCQWALDVREYSL